MNQNIDKVYHVYDQIGCKQSLTVNLCTNYVKVKVQVYSFCTVHLLFFSYMGQHRGAGFLPSTVAAAATPAVTVVAETAAPVRRRQRRRQRQ